MERTFAMIKPDGVKRRLIGEIIGRFEKRGFQIVALKMLDVSDEMAERHYAVHKGQSYYNELIDFVTSGPVVPMVLEAKNAVELVRRMMGSLDPSIAEPGTIRGDLTVNMQQNLIHGADSIESARREIALWFPELADN